MHTEALFINPSTTSLHQVKNYADTRGKYLVSQNLTDYSLSEWFLQSEQRKKNKTHKKTKTKKTKTILLFQFEYYHFSRKPEKQP